MRTHLILVGGGLANGLLAYRLAQLRPDVRLTVLEKADAVGGNHTWSFHASDLSRTACEWVEPFVVQKWASQSVRFRRHTRDLATPYCTVSSERFRERIMDRLGPAVRLDCDVAAVTPTHVELTDGSRVEGTAVIDGRGFPRRHGLTLGWQKFHGIEVRTASPHGLVNPILMDATVPQLDGFRFIYSLPLGPDRLLIEDTRYANTPDLDPRDYEQLLLSYASGQGWRIAEVLRRETGALPVALSGALDAFYEGRGEVAVSGLAAGLFHPTTGYSLPDAVRMADHVAALDDLSPASLSRAMRRVSLEAWRRRGFFRMLNRMLFHAAQPAERHRIFERFYTLDLGLIERFYADRLTWRDRLRILTGKPPVPIARAIGAIMRPPPVGYPIQGAFKR